MAIFHQTYQTSLINLRIYLNWDHHKIFPWLPCILSLYWYIFVTATCPESEIGSGSRNKPSSVVGGGRGRGK